MRKTLNTEYEGSGLLSYSLSIFFRSKESRRRCTTKAGGGFIGWWTVHGHWSDLVAIDGRELWRLTLFQLDPDTDADSFEVAGALIRAVGKPFSVRSAFGTALEAARAGRKKLWRRAECSSPATPRTRCRRQGAWG